MSNIIKIVLLLFALHILPFLCFYLSWQEDQLWNTLNKEGIRTQATIQECRINRQCSVTYQFKAPIPNTSNQIDDFKATSSYSCHLCEISIGTQIGIIYLPQSPEVSRIIGRNATYSYKWFGLALLALIWMSPALAVGLNLWHRFVPDKLKTKSAKYLSTLRLFMLKIKKQWLTPKNSTMYKKIDHALHGETETILYIIFWILMIVLTYFYHEWYYNP